VKLGTTLLFVGSLGAGLKADVVVTSTYSADGKNTASTTYASATRQRVDADDTRIIQQCDLKRIVQVDDKNKTYTVIPLTANAAPAAKPEEGCKNRPPSIDTGERKPTLGLLAQRWKTIADDCVDGSKTEIDGWYVGLSYPASCEVPAPAAGGPPGYPIQYTVTTTDKQGKSSTVSYAVADLQLTAGSLEANVFEVPAGFTEISLEKAMALRNPGFVEAVAQGKAQGTQRVGVATAGQMGPVDNLLVKMLRDAKVDAVPLGGGSDADIDARATDAKVDYLVVAEVTDMKQGGGSRLGGALSKASSLAGGGSKEVYTATVNYRLVPRTGGHAKAAASASGSTGQFGLREAMALGRMATMFTPMGMMMRSQAGGLFPFMNSFMGSGIIGGGPGMGLMGSVDPNVTVMQTSMMAGIPPAGPFGGESQEAAVSSALDKIAKSLTTALKAPAPRAAPAAKPSKGKKK
jgi:hypothetical protein